MNPPRTLPVPAPAALGRRIRVVAAVAAAVLMLTACGARIDTELTVDTATGGGERVMTLTLDAEDQEKVVGGAEALDASIRNHKPDEVEYSGITTGPAGELVAVFTVAFDDPGDYQAKIDALLAASGGSWSSTDNQFVVQSTDFVSGVDLRENFSSAQVLGWLFEGLEEDGVVVDTDASNMYELGSTSVVVDGVAQETGDHLSYSEFEDRGFTEVRLTTEVATDSYTRTVEYLLADADAYAADGAVYDDFFAGLEQAGLDVESEPTDGQVRWVVELTADSPERLVELTNTALVSDRTQFSMSSEPVADEPATSTVELVDFAECSAICSPEAGDLADVLLLPEGYAVQSGAAGLREGVRVTMRPGAPPVEIRVVHPFESVAVEVSLGRSGGLTWRGEFAAGPVADETVDAGFRELLAPGEHGELEIDLSESGIVYTVTFEAGSAAELAEKYGAWAGSDHAELEVEDAGGTLFRAAYAIHADLSFAPRLAVHVPAGTLTSTLTLPSGHSFSADALSAAVLGSPAGGRSVTMDGSLYLDARASGTTVAGYVLYGVLGLLLMVVVVLVIVFRRRIAGVFSRRGGAAGAPLPPPSGPGIPGGPTG